RTAVLTTTSTAPDALAEGVAAIASDLPRLADDGAVTVADPAGWLVGALKTLGIVVRTRTDRTERPATLEYGGRTVDVVPAEPGRATEVFLAALGALYCAGAELRMEPLGAPGSRFLPDLPTYPFQRRRFWIDEPDPSRQAHSAEPLAAAAPAGTAAPADAVASDLDSVERFLRTELSSALGATDELDLRLSFAELGGDSFTAMLFVKSVEDRYQAENLVDDFAVDQPVSDLLAGLAHTITRLSRPDGRAVR
ncbi:MAG TPA: phosphopantetheine-binding protein, partial [Micromonosporaceae bacterium]|nr:phosphopantetheine-binding protein [Micromonosporaceae bacterium]